MSRVLREQPFDVGGLDVRVPIRRDPVDPKSECVAQAPPQLAESAVCADADRIARREQIAERGFHGAASGRVNREHRFTRAEQRRQQLEDRRELR